MTQPDHNPLARALSILEGAQGQATDAHSAKALEEIRTALLDAVAERAALLDAGRKAMALIDALDNFEDAQDEGSAKLVLRRADVVEAAEGALVEALNRIVDRLQDKDAHQ